jgi:hypothetical protein
MLIPQIKKQTGRSVSVDGSPFLGWIWGVNQSMVVKSGLSTYGSASYEVWVDIATILLDV